MSEAPEYADLAEYLAAFASIVGRLDDLSALSDLAGEVKVAAVRSLLLARDPDILTLNEADPERAIEFIEQLNGVATEVEAIVGTSPPAEVRKIAVWAITVGVAASIEASLFPEQQLGDESSAPRLQIRYLSLLKRLEGLPGTGTGDGALGAVPTPRGTFPRAEAYPEPVGGYEPTYEYYYGIDRR